MNQLWERWEMLAVLGFYAAQKRPNEYSRAEISIIQEKLQRRTVASIQLRIANFAARDPKVAKTGQKGMVGGGEFVDQIWHEFSDDNGFLDTRKLLVGLSNEILISRNEKNKVR